MISKQPTFHAYNRVVSKESLFQTTEDYQLCKSLILRAQQRYRVKIFAWCLMPTHYHFVISGPRSMISKFFHYIFNFYCKYYNFKYRRHGHLMGGRIQYKPVINHDYYYNLMDYIQQNPANSDLQTPWPHQYIEQEFSQNRARNRGKAKSNVDSSDFTVSKEEKTSPSGSDSGSESGSGSADLILSGNLSGGVTPPELNNGLAAFHHKWPDKNCVNTSQVRGDSSCQPSRAPPPPNPCRQHPVIMAPSSLSRSRN